MERREDVLRQALDKNAYETDRWQAYKEDIEAAMRNLEMFCKNLTVEVMVPIGRKALMPGELIHTNELLVGHYQSYFSACSAHKATEICQHRLQQANEHLKKLQTEADLWQKKLATPIVEGAVPNAGEVEVVEEYNEEEHNKWLKEHKERLRKEKQEERKEREARATDGGDLLKTLEERELMEELGLDPNDLNEQTLSEMLNNKPESDQDQLKNKDCDKETAADMTDEQLFEMLDKLELQEQNEITQMDTEAEQNLQGTQEMVHNLMKTQTAVKSTKERIGKEKNIEISDEDEVDNGDEEEESDQPEEVKLIREQVALLPREERVQFINTQLQIIKAKMRQVQKKSFISDELTHLMNVTVILEDDLQELLFEHTEDASSEEQSEDTESLTEPIDNKKRRISFAKTDEQLVFRKNESVAEMLPKGKQHKREVISLDAPVQPLNQQQVSKVEPAVVNKSPQIMQKVEKNLEFVKENQSVQDFDLVNQILEASTGRIATLQINFNHSEANAAPEDFDKNSIPGNPSHFYQLYKLALAEEQAGNSFPIYVNSFEGEEGLKVPILKEEERERAYVDPRAEFSKPESKSILRNKSAVEAETHAAIEPDEPTPNLPGNSKRSSNKRNKNRKKKERTIDDELRDMSAYQKVMHDLVEKEPTTAPEPLPAGKYIDAHTPKKRVSRFKEQRSLSKT
ncbi:GH20003 [Drosophila grimshawi]|uniref:GH20003 n=1 Tax=Drosophila grimshawi TaxID=7222 RepID=B4J818_DROGR|nr:GH20003 [Drosophila grimshawi]